MRLRSVNLLFFASLFALAAHAQESGRMRRTMSDSIGRTQSFVCSVAMEAEVKSSAAAPAPPAPALRVSGGILDGKELYIAPANEADATRLMDLLHEFNLAGTGNYALFTRALFVESSATFSRTPDETKDGRKLARWEFRVPREVSRYTLNRNGKKAVVGYSGTIWADAASFDLVRLEWQSEDIPAELGTKVVAQKIDYARGSIAAVSVILPVASELSLLEFGREVRIRSRYEDCRSQVVRTADKFVQLAPSEPAAAPAAAGVPAPAAAPEAAGPSLPGDLQIETTLESAVDERGSAINDPITFKVTRDIKQGKKVLLPKGGVLSGRLTMLSRQTYRVGDAWKTYYVVSMRIDSLEANGERYRLAANLEEVGPTTVLETFIPFSEHPRKWGDFEDVRDQLNFPKPQAGESVLGVARAYVRLPKGLRMIWSTRDLK